MYLAFHKKMIQALLVASISALAADPMPYDSIANPLASLPSTNTTIQLKGDSLNLVPNRVRVNQAGYRQRDVAAGYAKFYYVGSATSFTVVNGNGVSAGSGTLTSKGATVSGKITAYASNSAEHAYNGEGDWRKGYPLVGTTVSGALMQGVLPTNLPAGRYTIRVGSDSSVPFIVSDNVYAMARDAALKFFGVARSGDYESWYHAPSHMWDGWLYDSAAKNADGTYKYKGALKGGWYDCGNHLKEARTNSFPLATLGMLAATMPEKDADRYALNQNLTLRTDGVPDVMREAWVGAQFVFNSWRLAKGKASDMYLSVGDLSWDFAWWGRPENHDAVLNLTRGGRRERVIKRDWGSASMADFAAGMAFLSRLYRPYDRAHADSALVIAKAMYETAKTANKKEQSEDYAADQVVFDDLGLAAIALLWASGESKYLQEAVFTKGLNDGVGGVCKSTAMSPDKQLRLFEGGYFACDPDAGMKKKGGPTDYSTVHSLALYSFAKLILVNADTAARYGVSAAQRDTFLLRTLSQMPGLWNQSPGGTIQIPSGDPYNTNTLSYDTTWYAMGIGYGKSGWWNKYQFGNLADLYMFYDMTSLVEGRAIVDKPGNTDWKRKEILQVLLGGLNYMFGTNALDLSYLYGIGRKNPMHPHHRAANPEGKNVPGAFYNYTIPMGGLYGGLQTGPANTEALVEKFGGPVGQTEANCPDAQAAVIIPLMGLASEAPNGPPKATVKVLYTTDTSALIQVDLDKWGTLKLGYGLDSSLALQTTVVKSSDTGNTFKIQINGLAPATQFFFHVVGTDLFGASSTSSKWPNGQSDSIPYSFTTKALPAVPPQYANIKVCNVTSDSAEIMWYTPNGEYLSSVKWADSANWKASKYSIVDTDFVGNVPVRFHRVKLYGLKPKTTYNFQVGVPGLYDPEVGCFRTPGEDVKFDIRTTHYTWDGKPAMGIAVVNQDVKSYDSLQIRLYVNGTRANIVDLAARVDIAFAYRADGFADSGLFAHTKNVQRSRPRLIDPTCNPDAGSCAWYFDLPLHGAVMETQARWRLDVVFDRHNLIRDSTEILNMAPTHDPFAVGSSDWSIRAHVAGGDNGLSPVAYPGVPAMSKNAIDSVAMDIPVNPYIAVYRRNEFIYGFSPSAAEQATKRTVYAMNASFDKPFDIPNGNTIEIGSGTATRLKGTLDPYDVLMPQVKGYITSVWVNGVALTDAERKAALTRQADGTWKVDLPLRFVTGTNKLDVTFFAGSDSVDKDVPGACTEGKGCAFYNASWYVNYVSNLTPSLISVVDGLDAVLGTVVADSSLMRVRVKDGNANKSKTAVDAVTVSVTNLRTGRTLVVVSLAETGVNTGVFQTGLRAAVSTPAVGEQFQTTPGDTLLFKYVDAADSADSSLVRVWVYSSVTRSALSVVDALNSAVRDPVPDSTSLRLRVSDPDANAARLLVDTVTVSVVNLRTLAAVSLRLPETGVNTGVFQTNLLSVVSAAAAAGQIQMIPGDSILVRYVDSDDPTDSSTVRLLAVSVVTPSSIAVVDAAELALGKIVPDSSKLRIRVRDGDANASRIAIDTVSVVVTDLRTLVSITLRLPETGVSTGVFQTDLLSAVSTAAAAGQIQTVPGDTLVARYVDAADTSDRSEARFWSVAEWPVLVGGKVSANCGALRIDAQLDRPLGGSKWMAETTLLSNTGFETPAATSSTQLYLYTGPFGGWDVANVDIVRNGGTVGLIGPLEGQQYVDLNSTMAGSIQQVIRTTPGSRFKVSFVYTVNNAPGGDGPDLKQAVFKVNRTVVDTLEWNIATQAAQWTPASYEFVGTGSDTLYFGSLVSGKAGILLDALSILSMAASATVSDSIVGGRVVVLGGDGDTILSRVLAKTDVQLGASGKDVAIEIGTNPFVDVAGGSLELRIKLVNGKEIATSARLSDGVGPWIDSAKIVENAEANPLDTVTLWSSEPLGTVGTTVPVRVYRAGAQIPVAAFNSFRLVDAATNRWVLTLPAGVVKPGDSIALATTIPDARGNLALDCPALRRNVTQQWRPTSVSAAWILDSDGDARADRIVLVYKRPLRAEEIPTALSATFGSLDSLRQAVVSAKAGDSVVTVAVPPYARSETRGSAPGGQGSITLYQGAVALGSAPLADSVGPALLKASLRYGASSDTLRLVFSETTSAAVAGSWLQKLSGVWADLAPAGLPVSVDGLAWSFPVDTFRVVPGDSVRPAPSGRFVDAALRGSALFHPGVVVDGTERPPVGGWMMDLDGDGAAETIELLWSRTPLTRPSFTVQWPAISGGHATRIVAQDSWTFAADPLRCRIALAPFDRGATSSDRTDLGAMLSGTDSVPFPIHDAVAPIVVSAQLRYGSADGQMDTLLAYWSEPIVWTGAQPLLMVRSGGPDSAVFALTTTPAADNRSATLLLDPAGALSTSFQRGDSVRLAPASAGTVTDVLGNASEPGWHVPVQFGRRPPRFDVSFHPNKRLYKGWPMTGRPAFDLQVRPRGATVWRDFATGAPVDSSVILQQLGPVIVTNQPLRGKALIYDNQGTFTASIDLEAVAAAFGTPSLPTDPSNQYEVRIAWNGVASTGKVSASGVYILRLILRQNLAGDGEVPEWSFYNQLFQMGWEVPAK